MNLPNEWIAGSVNIPLEEIASVRRKMRQNHNVFIDAAYELMKRFRTAYPTRTPRQWELAIQAVEDDPKLRKDPSLRIALQVIKSLGKPGAGKWSDFSGPVYSRAGVKTDWFPIFGNDGTVVGAIVFRGRKLTWFICNVTDYYGEPIPVKNFSSTIFGAKFHMILKSIKWHKLSGGAEMYSSEPVEQFNHANLKYLSFFGYNGHTFEITDEPQLVQDFLNSEF